MSRIGCIGYHNNSGLGQIIRAFRKHLKLDSQLVIEHPIKDDNSPITIKHTTASLEPTIADFDSYVAECKPEKIIVIETPFNFDFFTRARDLGIKMYVIPMVDSVAYEKFEPYLDCIEAFLLPTKWSYILYRNKTNKAIHTPYPIDTDEFSVANMKFDSTGLYTFLHNQGYGGAGFRKGTDIVYTAFQQLLNQNKSVSLWLNTQLGEEEHSQVHQDVKGVHVNIENIPETIDMYKNGLIYLAPSRREGLGLPILEAMSVGMPVITVDAPPMNERIQDKRCLVPVHNEWRLPYGDIPVYDVNVFQFMRHMQLLAELPMEELQKIGAKNRETIVTGYSWNVLKDTWKEALGE